MAATPETPTPSNRRVLAWAALVCALALSLSLASVIRPMLLMDDFPILARSWTWNDALANLWVPANEHSMPAGRLSTWLLVQLAARIDRVPLVLRGPAPLRADRRDGTARPVRPA